MAQSNRVVLPGLPHFVIQQGRALLPGETCEVFRESTDYRVFLHLLAESCGRYEVEIWGYSILPRGYRLVLVPRTEQGLTAAIERLDSEYGIYHNLRHMIRGAVWSGPFQSVPMCWSQIWDAIAHVEREPVRVEKVNAAWAHSWSSAAPRLGRSAKPNWLEIVEWERQFDPSRWQRRLQSPDGEQRFTSELTAALESGVALGEMLAVSAPLLRKGPQQADGMSVVRRARGAAAAFAG